MTDEKGLQEKMIVYRTLESRLEALMKQREFINSKLMEIISTIVSIDEIEKNKDGALFRLGGEAYVEGKMNNKKNILVEIGAGVILEKSIKESKEILNERKIELENTFKELQNNITQLSTVLNQLGPEINELIQESQKSSG
ncbi:MAG: prefoldin subunit alpha [Candidatus Aenigmarchaeota archaeon]|nr:prefoldin subunit alpha [Candidatus Aenigmarchaeota archaeon]